MAYSVANEGCDCLEKKKVFRCYNYGFSPTLGDYDDAADDGGVCSNGVATAGGTSRLR